MSQSNLIKTGRIAVVVGLLVAVCIAPLLDSYGMLLTVGDVQVVRGERF